MEGRGRGHGSRLGEDIRPERRRADLTGVTRRDEPLDARQARLGTLAGENGGTQLGQGGKEAGEVKVRGVYLIRGRVVN